MSDLRVVCNSLTVAHVTSSLMPLDAAESHPVHSPPFPAPYQSGKNSGPARRHPKEN